MAALRGLVQLPGIAQQYQVLGGVRDGEYVGERHLRGLVDEEDVHSVLSLWACPKPRGTRGHIISSSQRVKEFVIPIDEGQVRLVFLITVRLLYAPHLLASLRCRLEHRIQQIANDLMTGRRNTDFRPGIHECADHACADMSLPRSRRALNGKNTSLQLR